MIKQIPMIKSVSHNHKFNKLQYFYFELRRKQVVKNGRSRLPKKFTF